MKDINQRIHESVAENTKYYEKHIADLNREITEVNYYVAELEHKLINNPPSGVPIIEEISQVEDTPDINV